MTLELCRQNDCVSNTPITALNSKGVNKPIEGLLESLTPFPAADDGLSERTLSDLRKFFQQANHKPSQTMWEALDDLVGTLELMADGECPPHYYISSLDPGVGKTQSIIHFVRHLVSDPGYSFVGVVICVSRLDEVRSLCEAMNVSEEQYAVLTSDNELNALGNSDTNQAQVLFTTQQMIERRCEGKLYKEVSAFHYRNTPRQVRVWDESILPGQALTLNRDDLGALFKPLRTGHPTLVNALEDLFAELKDHEDGTSIEVPDFGTEYGVDDNHILSLLNGSPTDQINAASTLWFMSGKRVTVRKDGALGNTVLDYRETLPEDLAPMVILDASGRVRTTYEQWQEGRGGLVRLKAATKDYSNLVNHVWLTGGGKSSFRSKGQDLIDGIATTINLRPHEEWLVVHHKREGIGIDFEAEVRSLLSGPQENIHFITWGNHHATNAYCHVPNVILAGTLFYRPSYYEALGRLAADKRTGVDELSHEDFKAVTAGEHNHLVLQALCRGAVRKCDGDTCVPCNAYIIASVQSGIPEALRGIFPGCKVKKWQPVPKALKGKIKEAVEYITQRLSGNPEGFVKFTEVRDAVGIIDNANFRKNVRKHSDFQEALANEGIVEHGGGKHPTGFVNAMAYGYTSDPAEDFEEYEDF